MKRDIWTKEELELSERETAELAGLLALSEERKPPAALRERVLSSLATEPAIASFWAPLGRWAAATAAVAALLLAVVTRPQDSRAILAKTRGLVTVDGAIAESGARLKAGQIVSVSDDGLAVVSFQGKAAVRLLHGATASFSLGSDSTVDVFLQKGWALNAVSKGIPYSVVTPHGRISALGTDYLVKAQPKDTWLCICHGRIAINGKFGRREAASEKHDGWAFEAARAPYKPDDGTMEGHDEESIRTLRAHLVP